MRIEIEEPPPWPVTAAFTLLRVVTGLILAVHGWQKLNDFATWHAHVVVVLGVPAPDFVASLAVAVELLAGIGLALGLLTRFAAFGALCVTLVTIETVHLSRSLLGDIAGFEYPLTLLAISIAFMTIGGGRLSFDRVLRERARRRAIQTDERWHQPPYVAQPESSFYAKRGLHG